MPIDAQIPLMVQPAPQAAINPLQSVGQLMQLRDMAAQAQQRQYAAEHQRQIALQEQAVTEQKNRDLADANTLQSIQKDPDSFSKIMSGDYTPLLGRIQAKTLENVQKGVDAHIKELGTNTKQDLENYGTALGDVADSINGLKSLNDVGKINAAWAGAVHGLSESGALKAAKIDPTKIPTSITSLEDLDQFLASVNAKNAAVNKALAQKKETQQIETSAAQAESAAASAYHSRTEAQKTEMEMTGTLPISPYQQAQLDKEKTTNVPAEQQFVDEYRRTHQGATVAQAQRAYALNQHIVSPEAATNQLDRETTRFAKPHEKALADANTQLEKIADARAMINGSAEAQALGIPKVLTALVSGQGSGIRITQPEMNAILSARGVVGTVEGFINSLSGQGKLTDTQKQQLTGILDDVRARIQQKRDIANNALDAINSAKSRDEIVKIDSDARRKITGMETGPVASSGGGVPTPRNQAEYNAIPKGGRFMKPNDSHVYIKQ